MRVQAGGVLVWRFGSFPGDGRAVHFVSTRAGGVSPPPYDSLNLGFHVPDDPANVLENRRRLAKAVGMPLDSFVLCRQVHGDRVLRVNAALRGAGSAELESAPAEADAMMTNERGVVLAIVVADCVPLLLYDATGGVVAAAHAGWKGTAARIAEKTVDAMRDAFGSDPGNVWAGIGPSIGPCCYEIGPEVASAMREALPEPDRLLQPDDNGREMLDLWEANRRLLLAAGLREDSIEVAGLCTRCQREQFFSERSRSPTGRFAAAIALV